MVQTVTFVPTWVIWLNINNGKIYIWLWFMHIVNYQLALRIEPESDHGWTMCPCGYPWQNRYSWSLVGPRLGWDVSGPFTRYGVGRWNVSIRHFNTGIWLLRGHFRVVVVHIWLKVMERFLLGPTVHEKRKDNPEVTEWGYAINTFKDYRSTKPSRAWDEHNVR